MNALLLARLIALQYVITHANSKEGLPYLWLLFQYRPGVMLPTAAHVDIFTALFKLVVGWSPDVVDSTLVHISDKLYHETKLLYVISDESQVPHILPCSNANFISDSI